MDSTKTDTLAHIVNANDKLLKALITLLALREDHLLDELRAVLAIAAQEGNDIGIGSAATWAHVRKELALISELVESDGADDDADDERPALLS